MSLTRKCRGYVKAGTVILPPHDAPDDTSALGFGPGKSQCRRCYRAYYEDWKAEGPKTRKPRQSRKAPSFANLNAAIDAVQGGEYVSDDDLKGKSHAYRADPTLVQLWHAVTTTAAGGGRPATLLFLGPSGSGKTAGAQYLASLVGLPFTKVDAASMTDAMDWFGTREVVEQDGASVTVYNPSAFVTALQSPGVVLIDEVNRIRDEHRNIILPLTDGTGRVTNPLTGEVVVKHEKCFIIMSGNRGLQFTGTFAMDPALLTRAYVVDFDYAVPADETAIVTEATGVEDEVAAVLVRFANETRTRAKDPNAEMFPVSTREVLSAAELVAGGLALDLAVRFACINSSDEGTTRLALEQIWTGVRKLAGQPSNTTWTCPTCGSVKAYTELRCSCGTAKP